MYGFNANFLDFLKPRLSIGFLTMADAQDRRVWRYYDVKKSETDHRSYRGLELVNGIRVCLISDRTISRASVVLDANVGYFNDPPDMQGLACLCQRVMILGTSKQRRCNQFRQFLFNRGGVFASTTTADHTSFYVNVKSVHFRSVLGRFVHIFLTPLFKEDWIEREAKIIDLEWKDNLKCDLQRVHEFDKFTASNAHPYSKLLTGNEETLSKIPKLRGVNVRERLLEFFGSNYSGNRMSLCVCSNDTLDNLEKLVLDLFCRINGTTFHFLSIYDHPFQHPEEFCVKWYLIPKTPIKFVRIIFPLPFQITNYWSYQHLDFICHLLEHAGEDTLLQYLKIKNWCHDIAADIVEYAAGVNFLKIDFNVTAIGIMYAEDIIMHFFQYLKLFSDKLLIRRSSIQYAQLEWLFNTFIDTKEEKEKLEDNFNHLEMFKIVQTMQRRVFIKELSINRPRSGEFNLDLIHWLLKNYIKPKYIRIYSVARENLTEVPWTSIGPKRCNGLRYYEEKLDESIIDIWRKSDTKSMRLPRTREFLRQQ
ncbi:insulin-degrading enzyme-like [Pseudomyrmex gracilis]|uniref:insulin-degrading enzyme-like n=1 Tax=Pseudomyrmex gracilis TaxID=219809 RepID=UPI0009956958|nr:insulin-degrading enzyme-like [Pseudomyrmex gracilis]